MKRELIFECIEFFTSTHSQIFILNYSILLIYLIFKNIHLLSLDLKDILDMLFLDIYCHEVRKAWLHF